MTINSVVVGVWSDVGQILAASRRSPDAVLVSVRQKGMAARNGISAYAPAAAIRVFLWIACASQPISNPEIVDLLYGDCADGGPDDASAIVRKVVADAKVLGAALGVIIASEGHRGYIAREPRKAA